MRILLYNPDNGVTRNFMPHLWMFLLQALTPPGHEVLLVDGNARAMDSARLVEGYKRILRTIYSPSEYYRRALDCLSRLTEEPEPRRARLADEVSAFVRVVLTLGVRDGGRAEFWRYLRRAATSHRRHFAHAVTLAAMGYHFRRLTESFSE
jgi:hypothetical protein